jgi:hypothetical protein
MLFSRLLWDKPGFTYRYNNDSHYYKRQTSLAGASATISESDISTGECCAKHDSGKDQDNNWNLMLILKWLQNI